MTIVPQSERDRHPDRRFRPGAHPVILSDVPGKNEVVDSPLRVRGELDLHALRAQDSSGLLDGIDRAVVWDIKMTTRFRGIARRDGVLLHGGAGWGEVAPFWNHDLDASVPWLASGLEWALAGTTGLPRNRHSVPVNVTIPEVSPAAARILVRRSSADTAKVKVAGASDSNSLDSDIQRLGAVRDELGPEGRIRIDANGAWDPRTAAAVLPLLDRAAGGLQYVEQPCPDLADLVALRRAVDIPIAADESIRLSTDPLAVARSGAVDVVILKAAPLGGVRRAYTLAQSLGMPAVVSSALDTSVGLSAGVSLAAALPELAGACGLGTIRLLDRDVAAPSFTPVSGALPVRPVHVSRRLLASVAADDDLTSRWQVRLGHIVNALRTRRERERRDPGSAIAGIPL